MTSARTAVPAPAARARGFTLVEMLTVIAIVIILMTLGVPSLKEFARDAKLRTTSNNLAASLYHARTEAVKRGESVVVESISGNKIWSEDGWVTYFDADGDSTADDAERLRVDPVIDSAVLLTTTTNTVSFLPTGASSSALTFTLCLTDDPDGRGRQIVLLRVGRVQISEITCGS